MKPFKSREYVTLLLSVVTFLFLLDFTYSMSAEEKKSSKEQVVELFYHAFNSYMDHAYPADELMPLSCKGRYRGSEPSRGDVDDTLGNFTLTLIDSLDTLAVLGDVDRFEEAVRKIVRDARFDCDVIVSVFETNIRILGGLLGGHVMASYFKRRGLGLGWYNDELLSRAKEVGDRLLPAFNTTTGIPYPRVNLKHGIVSHISSTHRDTCTACAGSMILEFAALSRLTGLSVYEEKARRAMDYLWKQRHRGSDLMGTIINVHSGDWIRRESGVGAGIDSYYEYVLKAYILLGDDNYLDRFNKHYDAVMRYVSQGPLLIDVHMHKPNAISRNFMDALLAFWPGLQVLKGDLVPAIETHEMLYQVVQRHNFIPEAFTSDFRVHWSHHPLRPEFIESTYFLYKATGDNYYLEAGKKVLDNLEQHAKVPCGLAAIKNVKTGAHEDQMDSYVLAEMFKYLYLLFAEKEDMVVDIDDFIFTTEAHLLPLSLSMGNITSPTPKVRREVYDFHVDISQPASGKVLTLRNKKEGPRAKRGEEEEEEEGGEDFGEGGDHTCPALHTTHASGHLYPHTVRSQVKDAVNRVNPQRKNRSPRLRASEFIAGNKEQLEQLHAMGIRIATMADGRVQLLHTAAEAHSPEDAEDGMHFMQEMIELTNKQQADAQHDPMYLHVKVPGMAKRTVMLAGPAQFGYDLRNNKPVTGMLAVVRPYRSCKEIENVQELSGHIVLLERGDCMFVDKARNLQRVGAIGGIVIDHTEGSTSDTQPLFAMSGDGSNDVHIPMVFLYHTQGKQLLQQLADNSFLEVTFSVSAELPSDSEQEQTSPESAATDANPTPKDELPTGEGREGVTSPPTVNLEALGDVPLGQGAEGRAATEGEADSKEAGGDSFSSQLGDKYYHHEAQLRDLYYLQVGSRYVHINVEVRPSPAVPEPLEKRENTFNLDALPDGSKMATFRLAYQTSEGYADSKPQLNQLYVDMVHLLQLHSNFNSLPHTADHLRALARCLEAGYFGLSSVSTDVLTLLRMLGRQLQYLHRFPGDPQPPVLAKVIQASDGAAGEGGAAESRKAYAGTADFEEQDPSSRGQREKLTRVGEGQGEGQGQGQFVKFVPPGEEGERQYGAHVDEKGRLNLVREPPSSDSPTPRKHRNAISVKMSAESQGEEVVVKISDDQSTISQSQSFGVRDSPSEPGAKTQQPPTSRENLNPSSQPGDADSQSGSSSGAVRHADSSSRPEDGVRTGSSSQEGGEGGVQQPWGSWPGQGEDSSAGSQGRHPSEEGSSQGEGGDEDQGEDSLSQGRNRRPDDEL